MDDPANSLIETATFCKLNDNKRPGAVPTPDGATTQVCSDTLSNGAGVTTKTFDATTGLYKYTFTAGIVTDAVPTAWYARVQFDELINTDVEELVEGTDPMTMQPNDMYTGHIDHTLPFTLKCGTNNTDVPYDGYYSPAGNSITWPLGPSLVIQPSDPNSVATSATCALALKPDAVHDKDGNKVPTDQLGPWMFSIAPLTLTAESVAPEADPSMPPAAGDEEVNDVGAPLILNFNAHVDAASLTPAEVKIEKVTDCTAATGTAVTAGVMADPGDPTTTPATPGDPTAIWIYDSTVAGANAWSAATYRVTFTANNSVSDVAGGTGMIPAAADLTICFTAM